MLQELLIKDFALIHEATVSFKDGFNILTGETGAGKSIIIDALNAVLGGKVGPSIIRSGAEKACAEGTFRVNPNIMAWLKEQELVDDETAEVVVSREITKTGSRARINGTLVNVSTLQELRQRLVTIHAQLETRTLLSPQAQLDMLDSLGDDSHKKLQAQVRSLYARRKELDSQLKEMRMSEDERERRLDFARFQLTELEEARLQEPDEDETISKQCRSLANVVQLEGAAQLAQQLLADGDEDGNPSAIDLVQKAVLEIQKASEFDEQLTPIAESLSACLDTLEQEQRSLRRYRDSLETDPESLSTLEARLAQLASIKRKYGPTLADAIATLEKLSSEVEKLSNAQDQIADLEQELAQLDKELHAAAAKLSAKRKALANKLETSILKELSELGMEHCKFEIALSGSEADAANIGPAGADRAEFMISPNPGQPLQPVAKIASGGELSRVMLAIKTIFAEADNVATVIFDEIDTGLSGKVLQTMRDKLAALAKSHQILCITHQPIIASIADNHLRVSKHQTQTSTHVSVASLEGEDRLKAVAGMASGHDNQAQALEFAKSLFADGSRLRAQLSSR